MHGSPLVELIADCGKLIAAALAPPHIPGKPPLPWRCIISIWRIIFLPPPPFIIFISGFNTLLELSKAYLELTSEVNQISDFTGTDTFRLDFELNESQGRVPQNLVGLAPGTRDYTLVRVFAS